MDCPKGKKPAAEAEEKPSFLDHARESLAQTETETDAEEEEFAEPEADEPDGEEEYDPDDFHEPEPDPSAQGHRKFRLRFG